jgi:hypothetical protein
VIGNRPRRWRRLVWRLFAVVFGLAAAVAIAVALSRLDWSVVPVVWEQREPGEVGLLLGAAFLVSLLGLPLGFLAWRAMLLELGPPVSGPLSLRIFFVAFLSKYVPGKLPGLIAVMKVASASGVNFARLVGAGALTMGIVILTGLGLGLLAGVEVLGAQSLWLAGAAVAVAVVLARPHLVNFGVRLLLRVLRRPESARPISARGIRLAVAAQSLSWLVSGLHLWFLAVAVGAPPMRSLLLCLGAFSLATAIGMLVVFVPDGIGVRESILMAALILVLPAPLATVVAVASRLVSTLTEVALGVGALAAAEIAVRRSSTLEPVAATD